MPDNSDSVRLFIAINFPPEVKSAVSAVIDQLKGVKGKISWVKSEGVHLTLKFLGQTSSQNLERIKKAIEVSISDIQPFNLRFEGLGVFPDYKRPRVIWWGLKCDSPLLTQLYNNIERQLAGCGFLCEDRQYVPHLTLGRVRELAGSNNLESLIAQVKLPEIEPVFIKSIELMISNVSRDGAVYTPAASFALKV